MKSIVARLKLVTGASLLSTPVIIVFIAMSMSPNVMFDILTKHGPAGAWLPASAVATVAGVGVILAFAPVLLKSRRATVDTAVAIAVIAIAALAKSAVITVLASDATLTWPLHVSSAVPIGQRTVTNLAYTILGVGIACAVVTRTREHRARRLLLLAERQRLVTAGETTTERLRRAEEELRLETHEVLDPAVAQVCAALENGAQDADTARVLASLNSTVSDVIRPMSHRFARESPMVSYPQVELSVEQADPFGWTSARVDVPALIRPWLIFTLSALSFGLIAPVASAPRLAFITAGVTYLVTALILVAVRAAWPRRWRHLRGGTAIATLLLLYLLVFGVTGLAFNVSRIVPGWENFALMSLGYRTIISMAISMTVLVQEQRRIVDEGIAQVNAELTRHLSVLRRDLWAIRRRMSTTLHGSVQSALTSAMLLLSTDPSPANVSEVRQRLDQALLAIDLDEQAAAVIEHGLREISAVWSGVAEVNASTSAEAMALLAHQQGLSAAVLEIAREGVGNAIRHGRAQEVDVRIVIIEGGLISIVIADDGSGLGDDVRAGLGSLMLDEVCISWHRESAEKGVRLTAVLA